jgi:membrane-associated phospholipid phosphatase
MEKFFAKFFSALFHPLLMTSVGLLILFNSGTSLAVVQPEVKKVSMIVVFLFTCVFPIGLMVMLYLTKMIKDFELSEKRERTLPIALTIILLLFTFFVMKGIPQLERAHISFLLSPVVGMILILAVNRYMKPSVHMLGLGGLMGMLLVIIVFFRAPLQPVFVMIVLAAGITGSARLILKLHTPKELLVGLLTGFLATSVVMIVFLA